MEAPKVAGAIVESVERGSPAAQAGIQPGDQVVAINGERFADLIEYRFLVSEEFVRLEVVRDGARRRFRIEKDVDEPLGLVFSDAVFDGIRKCKNSCVFCFIHQMPEGMRDTLYVEDDDFRLSITHGNYVTLTNMSEEDFRRVISLHLSPMHISVHATDPAARIRMLRNKRAGQLLPLMQRLADAEIDMHCQIVLCPGYNDGAQLDKTLEDLAAFHPAVLSVAVVPLGLTRFRQKLTPMQPVTPEFCRETLAQLEGWRARFLERLGTRFVFPADELYFQAGLPVPPREAYEEFPQMEDGIGLARRFLDELEEVRRLPAREAPRSERVLLVTGMLAHPLVDALAREASRLSGHRVEAVAVSNRFFGEAITVTGLLTGRDIRETLLAAGPADRVMVPTVLLKEDRFLDDLTVAEMADALGVPVEPIAPSPLALARHLMEGAGSRPPLRCAESRGAHLYITETQFEGTR